MKPEEYATMFDVEDRHWWYAGLRGIVAAYWRRYVRASEPVVLDAGCGTGGNLEAVDSGVACGIDLSRHAVGFCRERGLERTAVASATELPFADESFDVVLSMDVIQHEAVLDKMAPLRDMHRVLKRGGVLLVNVPAYQWLHSSHDVAVHQDTRYTKRALGSMLRGSGFTVLRTSYWNTILFPPAACVRLYRKLHPQDESDLAGEPSDLANALFGGLLALERAVERVCPLPFGLSVFAAARRDD